MRPVYVGRAAASRHSVVQEGRSSITQTLATTAEQKRDGTFSPRRTLTTSAGERDARVQAENGAPEEIVVRTFESALDQLLRLLHLREPKDDLRDGRTRGRFRDSPGKASVAARNLPPSPVDLAFLAPIPGKAAPPPTLLLVDGGSHDLGAVSAAAGCCSRTRWVAGSPPCRAVGAPGCYGLCAEGRGPVMRR